MSWLQAIPILGGIIKRWQQGSAAKEQHRHTEVMQPMTQFANEFGYASSRTWFDVLIDGLNRLPRPVIVSSIMYYMWLSWADPEYFAQVNQGLATIPEAMWALILSVVGFFFTIRELHHSRTSKRAAQFEQAAVAASLTVQKPPVPQPESAVETPRLYEDGEPEVVKKPTRLSIHPDEYLGED